MYLHDEVNGFEQVTSKPGEYHYEAESLHALGAPVREHLREAQRSLDRHGQESQCWPKQWHLGHLCYEGQRCGHGSEAE